MRTLLLLFLVLGTFAFQSRPRLIAAEAEALRAGKGEEVEIVFSHQLHVDDEGLDCTDCHADVEASRAGTDNLMPTHETCSDCHDVDDEATCGTCHNDTANPRIGPRIVDYSRLFSHELHLAADVACASCHEQMDRKTTVEPYHLPTMVACLDCHETRHAPTDDCRSCHTPDERLTPRNHTTDFMRRTHGDLAATQAVTPSGDKTCQTCHSDDFCQDCHEGDNLDRFTHPLNFAFTHALEAQAADQNCSSCHTDRQFCTDCHRDNQILPHTHRPGWVNRLDGGRHRFEATADLESCIACHESDADRICQPCHAGGATF